LEANSISATRLAQAQRPRIDVARDTGGYAAVVALRGEHDIATSEAVRVALDPLRGAVLLDLRDCEFIDSTIIETLLARAQQLAAEGHRVDLLLPPPRSVVARALELINIRDVVEVRESLGDARPLAPGPNGEARSLFDTARAELER
jgi:anti-anti-sigma factor